MTVSETYALEIEIKQLKDSIEDLQQSHDTYVKEVWNQHMYIQELKQKLEQIEELYSDMVNAPKMIGKDSNYIRLMLKEILESK